MSETKRESMAAIATMLVFFLIFLCSSAWAEEEKIVQVSVNVYISRPDLNTRTIDIFKKTTPHINHGNTTDMKMDIDAPPGSFMRIEYELHLPEGKDLMWAVRVNGRNQSGSLVSKFWWQTIILRGIDGKAYDMYLELQPTESIL